MSGKKIITGLQEAIAMTDELIRKSDAPDPAAIMEAAQVLLAADDAELIDLRLTTHVELRALIAKGAAE